MPATRLTLHEHPFASYCQKVLIALYELELPFEVHLVEGEDSRAELAEIWPIGGIPVLRDESAELILPESTTIIEYLDGIVAEQPKLIPDDPAAALEARRWDRFHDHYIATPMQKIVSDELRPSGSKDPAGVAEARETLGKAYGVLDDHLASSRWAGGEDFGIADCAAAPALFYSRVVHRWDEEVQANITRYYRDVTWRPSMARVIDEARPYREIFPLSWPEDIDAHHS